MQPCRVVGSWTVVGLACAAVIASTAGCGSSKRSPLTIAERLTRARAIKTPDGVARELAKVARVQNSSGDASGASKTLEEARAILPADGDAMIVTPRLIDIAGSYALMGEKASARIVVDQAMKQTDTVTDPVARAEMLAQAAAISGTIGDKDKARKGLATAADLALGSEVPDRFRPKALAAVAIGYAKAQLAGDAQTVTEKLESLATGLDDLRQKAEALAAAAGVHAATGAKERAASLLADAEKAATAIEGSANKAHALIVVAEAFRDAGDATRAKTLASQAEKAAERIGDPEQQKQAMREIRSLEATLR